MEYLILLAIIGISYVVHNMTVVYAASFVLFLRLLPFETPLSMLGKDGLNWGIIILTAAILVPIADGSITAGHLIDAFKSAPGIAALLSGLVAAILGGSGIVLLKTDTDIVVPLIIGTMIGVLAFKGIAIGPLIAAGMTYYILKIIEYFN